MSVDVQRIATMFAVPTQMLEDYPLASRRYMNQLVARDMGRHFTAAIFGEDWHGPQGEMERLEFGRLLQWDRTVWDDDDEDDW